MRLKYLLLICLPWLTSLGQAQDVFNTSNPPSANNANLYGDSATTTVQSPDYYNNLITTQNNQAYQAIVTANKANQNNPNLTALQQQLVSGANNPAAAATNQTPLPSNPTPTNPPPQIVVPPQPNIMYQTPVANAATNNTATNFGGSSNTSNSGGNGSSNNSGGGNLDIQY